MCWKVEQVMNMHMLLRFPALVLQLRVTQLCACSQFVLLAGTSAMGACELCLLWLGWLVLTLTMRYLSQRHSRPVPLLDQMLSELERVCTLVVCKARVPIAVLCKTYMFNGVHTSYCLDRLLRFCRSHIQD